MKTKFDPDAQSRELAKWDQEALRRQESHPAPAPEKPTFHPHFTHSLCADGIIRATEHHALESQCDCG